MNDTATINANEKYCHSCGSVIKKEAEICVKCGVRQTPAELPKVHKSRSTAALLAFLFGSLGIHRFYLGQMRGFFYLVPTLALSWTIVVPILMAGFGVFECLAFILTKDEDWNKVH